MELNSNFTLADINEISADETSSDEFEVNEVSRGKRWNNNNYRKSGYNNNEISAIKLDTTTKPRKTSQVINGNTRRGMQKLPSYRNHHISFLQNLVSPFSGNLNVAMQLKKEELKKKGKVKTEVSEITEDDMISAFGVTKDHMLKAAEILGKEENTENLGNLQPDSKNYGPENYGKNADKNNKEVLFIQTGSTKGTMFKINVDGLVFSSLFDTGAQVSASNMTL